VVGDACQRQAEAGAGRTQIKAKPSMLGLNAEALWPKYGKLRAMALDAGREFAKERFLCESRSQPERFWQSIVRNTRAIQYVRQTVEKCEAPGVVRR
jgi:hypothetical protein